MVKVVVVSLAWLSSIGLTWHLANQHSEASPAIAQSSNNPSEALELATNRKETCLEFFIFSYGTSRQKVLSIISSIYLN